MTFTRGSSRTLRGGASKRWPRVLGAVVAVVALVALAFWAGRATLSPTVAPSNASPATIIAKVTEQTVGRTLHYNVTIRQESVPIAVNTLTGVVTQVAGTGTVKQGTVLYRVEGRPVMAIQGTAPFYRVLRTGVQGTDVRQLRDALVKHGYLKTKGDTFDSATRAALVAWQGRLSTAETGEIGPGQLIAVPKLPATLTIDRDVLRKGMVLNGGEKVVSAPAGVPQFTLVLADQQARMVPTSAQLTIEYKSKKWDAIVTDSKVNESGETVLALTAPDGGNVCGSDCDIVQGGSELHLPADIEVIPAVTGPAVPVAAVTTAPDGSATVIVVSGEGQNATRPVTVRGSQDGMAVVDGVQVGETVRVLDVPAAPTSGRSP